MKKAAKRASHTGKKTISAVQKLGCAVAYFIKRNPSVMFILLICLLLIFILQSCIGGALTVANGSGQVGPKPTVPKKINNDAEEDEIE